MINAQLDMVTELGTFEEIKYIRPCLDLNLRPEVYTQDVGRGWGG